ncbi:MAG: type III-A CRISPR-associated RAMP protein Csm5 [Thermodesulfobacteriota bacterium]
MKLQIKTLSPLHIGNGEKYNGLSYVVSGRRVLFYDSTEILENITSQYSKRFMEWIEQKSYEVERLEKQKRNEKDDQKRKNVNRLLRDAQKKLSLREFTENAIRDANIKNRFSKNFLYAVEVKSQVYDNVDIDCFIKQNNEPYIPGTEIKGAIRTCVLYNLLQKDIYWKWLKGEIESFKRKHENDLRQVSDKKGKWVNDIKKKLVDSMGKLEERLQAKLLRLDNNDAKYDLLKLLHIGDTDLKSPSQSLFISDVEVRGTRPLKSFQELCKKDQTFTCQGFKLDNNKVILDKLGFTDEQKWVSSDVKNLSQCCYDFSNRLIDEELAYQQYPQKIKARLVAIKNQNKPDSPVIRIGKNEGYLSLTVGLLVKERDKALYDKVLCHATKNTSYTGNFPKTRRIVNLENGDVDTCGWVKLQIVT